MSHLNIAIAGLGVVGAETASRLISSVDSLSAVSKRPLKLRAVCARTKKDRGFSLDGVDWEDDAIALARRDDIDLVVELIGGAEGPALDLCRMALEQGKDVVTANKAMIAHHGHELAKLAERTGAELLFEAAVAGGIPALKLLREGLAANQLSRVTGILNGTCNYILSEMSATGRGFDEVLGEAQEKGFAEADPSFDVDGIDAAHKLAILVALSFGEKINFRAVDVIGIRSITDIDIAYAGDLGYVIKLLGIAEKATVPTVQPCLVAKDSQLAQISGALNAVEFRGIPVQSLLITGPGAGAMPTASAVLADILDIANNRKSHPFGRMTAELVNGTNLKSVPARRYYLRLMVRDEIGVLCAVTAILREHNISVESMLQKSQSENAPVALGLTMHPTEQNAVIAASKRLQEEAFVSGEVIALPIFDSA